MLLVIAALAGCSTTSDVTLELVDSDRNCDDAFAKIKTLSIEALANNGQCRLAHECVFDVGASSVAELAAALRASADVLLEVDPGDAQVLKINGRPLNDCFPREPDNHPVVCGNANLGASRDGVLTIELEPDGCVESIDLCP
jgi:hypothetical protein